MNDPDFNRRLEWPAEPEGVRVGNLVTMNQDEYPGLGEWFTQIWCGDDVVARIYGKDHEQIRERIDAMLTASLAPEPDVCTPAMEAAAEKYWKERRFKGLSEDPRTWKGLYKAMCVARQQEEAER